MIGAGEERPGELAEHQVEDEHLVPDPEDEREGERVDDDHQQRVGQRPEKAEDRTAVLQLEILEDERLQQAAVAVEAHEDGAERHLVGAVHEIGDRRARDGTCARSRSQHPRAAPADGGNRKEQRVGGERHPRDPLEPHGDPQRAAPTPPCPARCRRRHATASSPSAWARTPAAAASARICAPTTSGTVDQAPGRNAASRSLSKRSQYDAMYAPTPSSASRSTLSSQDGRTGTTPAPAGRYGVMGDDRHSHLSYRVPSSYQSRAPLDRSRGAFVNWIELATLNSTPQPKHGPAHRVHRPGLGAMCLQLVRRVRGRWARRGDIRAVASSRFFSRQWYLSRYPDVAESGMDPALHYVLHGGAERRSPGPDFDAHWYLMRNPDVAASGVNPLLHYIEQTGEGRKRQDRGSVWSMDPRLRQLGRHGP